MSNVIPIVPADIIPEDEITPKRLAALLDAAILEYEIDNDGDIYVREGLEFPIWIGLDVERKLIKLFTYCKMDLAIDASTYGHINTLNRKLIVSQFNFRDDALWGHYWASYSGGALPRQFVKMLRLFASVFTSGVRELGNLTEGSETPANHEQHELKLPS